MGSAACNGTRGWNRGRRRGRCGGWGRCGWGNASQALQHGQDRRDLTVADGDRFGEPAGAVEYVRHLVHADLLLRMDELSEAVAVEGDAALGNGEVVVHAQEGGEHAGGLALGVGLKVGERGVVQVLDASGYLGGLQMGQPGAFMVGGAGPSRHAAVPGW